MIRQHAHMLYEQLKEATVDAFDQLIENHKLASKQREKIQSRETSKQVTLHSIDEINEFVNKHKYGLVDFDEQLFVD